MVKWFIILLSNIFLIWFVSDYSYKSGAHDILATTTYVEASNSYITLYMLRNKSPDEVLKFYEEELDFDLEIHAWAAENKSALHGILELGQHKPNTEYYKKILKYREQYPSKNGNVISSVTKLISTEDKTF